MNIRKSTVVLCACLLAVACGGDDEEGGKPGSGGTSAGGTGGTGAAGGAGATGGTAGTSGAAGAGGTPAPFCGEGVINNGEQCERRDGCASGERCTATCTCAPGP